MEENLRPFGDHSSGHSRFCGFKRKPQEKYIHISLPHKTFVIILGINVKTFLDPVINNIEQMAYLESIQQCELANREVTLWAPKSLHKGNSESLDFRVGRKRLPCTGYIFVIKVYIYLLIDILLCVQFVNYLIRPSLNNILYFQYTCRNCQNNTFCINTSNLNCIKCLKVIKL